jgi:DinB family protein
MPEPNTDHLIDTLDATPRILAELVATGDDAAFDKAWPGEWSPRTVLAHLRDDEFLVMRLRLERMLGEQTPMLMPFNETEWERTRYTGRDALDELIADLAEQRAASVAILRRLTPEEWQRPAYQPEIGELTIATWAQHWVEHDQTHINQVRAGLGLTN